MGMCIVTSVATAKTWGHIIPFECDGLSYFQKVQFCTHWNQAWVPPCLLSALRTGVWCDEDTGPMIWGHGNSQDLNWGTRVFWEGGQMVNKTRWLMSNEYKMLKLWVSLTRISLGDTPRGWETPIETIRWRFCGDTWKIYRSRPVCSHL